MPPQKEGAPMPVPEDRPRLHAPEGTLDPNLLRNLLLTLGELALSGKTVRIVLEVGGARVELSSGALEEVLPPVRPAEPMPTPPDQPHSKYSQEVAESVLNLLDQAGRRMVGRAVEDALAGQAGGSVVRHTLAEMVRRGKLTNCPRGDSYGKGYGLPGWGQEEGGRQP